METSLISKPDQDFYKQKVLEYAHNIKNINLAKRGITNTEVEKIYVIYARRSTKGKDKQERSVDDQIAECKEFAQRNNLKVYGILTEKETAHKSNMRSVFAEILNNIEEGKLYNSILSWHPDRLARNMRDAGVIIDMLDEGKIADLKFSSYTFNNDPSGKMALGIQFVLAKNYSDGISVNTTRGSNRTVAEGKAMGKSKHGYIIVDKYYRPDPKTFPLFKRAWQMLSEGSTLGMISSYLAENGYKNLNDSTRSRVFGDPFYAGIFIHGDNVIELETLDRKFEPMIGFKEFVNVREVIDGRRSFRPTTEIKNILFKKMAKCGYCNHYMTPYKSRSKTGERYYYIGCSNEECISNKNRRIRSAVRGKVLMDFVVEVLNSRLNVNKELYESFKNDYSQIRGNQVESVNDALTNLNTKIQNLNDRLNGFADSLKNIEPNKADPINIQIKKTSDEIYELSIEKELLEDQKIRLESNINEQITSYENFSNFFDNAQQLISSTKDLYLIDQLVRNVFSNFVIKGGKVISYELNEPFKTYQKVGVIKMGYWMGWDLE